MRYVVCSIFMSLSFAFLFFSVIAFVVAAMESGNVRACLLAVIASAISSVLFYKLRE